MNEEQYGRGRLVCRKEKKKRRIIKGIMIIALCVISFFGGRAWAAAGKGQNSLSTDKSGYTDLTMAAIDNGLAKNPTEQKTKEKPDPTKGTIDNGSAQKRTLPKKTSSKPETKTKDKQNIRDWNLLLVNSSHPIPDDFSVNLVQLKGGQTIDERAYPDLQNMMDDARNAGLSPIICSSYRTMEKQTSLFNKKVMGLIAQGYSEIEARTEAGKWIAVPGTSEHQLGLAVDIVSESYQILDEQQQNTAEQKWLTENSYKYGFILRYPADKSEITGIDFEPWHYRYVGKEIAAEIDQKGICLEEYLGIK